MINVNKNYFVRHQFQSFQQINIKNQILIIMMKIMLIFLKPKITSSQLYKNVNKIL
jgi:hypothetical protein